MNRHLYEPAHLRSLVSTLHSEVKLIEAQNRSLKKSETASGLFFPVEKNANLARIKNLSEAAQVLEALAEKRIVVAA